MARGEEERDSNSVYANLTLKPKWKLFTRMLQPASPSSGRSDWANEKTLRIASATRTAGPRVLAEPDLTSGRWLVWYRAAVLEERVPTSEFL
jgi:hypothetical protein